MGLLLPMAVARSDGLRPKRLCPLLGAFVNELSRSYKRRAKRHLGLRSVDQASTRTVTFVQRFDSALRLNGTVRAIRLLEVHHVETLP